MIDRRRLAKANSGESNASAVTGQGLGGYAAAAMLCVDSDDVDTVIMTSHVIKSKSISFFVVGCGSRWVSQGYGRQVRGSRNDSGKTERPYQQLIRPAAEVRSLTELAVTEGYIANPGGRRGFRIGIDASIWFFHAAYGREGENPELRTLFFRCCRLLQTPLLPLFVFDGPKRPAVKRGKRVGGSAHWLTTGMKNIIQAFGFEWRTAPGEAEAELAYLNRIGVIDAVLSDDADNFLFGATMVIRKCVLFRLDVYVLILRSPSSTLSGNRSRPVTNSEGRDDGNHVLTYRASAISTHASVQITRSGAILIALLSGGDYIPAGLPGCGKGFASGLARAGFGESLVEAVNTLKGERLDDFLSEWRNQIRVELKTNSSGFLPSKKPSLAGSLPDSFPSLPVLLSYVSPITSETERSRHPLLPVLWSNDPDPAQIAALCELYFEWGVKDVIIKRFRTVLWPGIVCRALRRKVVDTDDASQSDHTSDPKGRSISNSTGTSANVVNLAFSQILPSTSKKGSADQVSPLPPTSYSLASFPLVASASRPSSHIDNPNDNKDSTSPLLLDVLSIREHPSTDRTPEFRVLINPTTLVDRAASGVRGIRPPLDVPLASDDAGSAENGDDELDGDGGATDDVEGPERLETAAQAKTKKKVKGPRSAPAAPTASLRLWLPAVMVRAVVPELVHGYEEKAQKRALKNAKKGAKGAKGTATSKVGSKNCATAIGSGDDAATKSKPKRTTAHGKGPRKASKQAEVQDEGYEYFDLNLASTCSEDESDASSSMLAKVKGKGKAKSAMAGGIVNGPTKGKSTVKDSFSTIKPSTPTATTASKPSTNRSKLSFPPFDNFTHHKPLPLVSTRPLDVVRSRATASKDPPNLKLMLYEEEESSSPPPSPVKTTTQRAPVFSTNPPAPRKPPTYVDVSSDEIEITEVRQVTVPVMSPSRKNNTSQIANEPTKGGKSKAAVAGFFTAPTLMGEAAPKVNATIAKSGSKLAQMRPLSDTGEESSHSGQSMGIPDTLMQYSPPKLYNPHLPKSSDMGISETFEEASVIHISSGSDGEMDELSSGIADMAMIMSTPPVLSDPEKEPGPPPRITSKFKPAPIRTARSRGKDTGVGLTKAVKVSAENTEQDSPVMMTDITSNHTKALPPLLVARAKASANRATSALSASSKWAVTTSGTSIPKARKKILVPEDNIIDLT